MLAGENSGYVGLVPPEILGGVSLGEPTSIDPVSELLGACLGRHAGEITPALALSSSFILIQSTHEWTIRHADSA